MNDGIKTKVIFKGNGDVRVLQNNHTDHPEDEDDFIDYSVMVDGIIDLTYDERDAAMEVGEALNKHFISGYVYLS
jgi:hypothetical protein